MLLFFLFQEIEKLVLENVSGAEEELEKVSIRPLGYKTFFMLNLTEHKISTTPKSKIPSFITLEPGLKISVLE